MRPEKQSRRAFLSRSGAVLGGSWMAWSVPTLLATADFACQAHSQNAPFEVLTAAEAETLEAIAAQIFPTDDTPGAREAGVIYFMDRALGTFMAGSLASVQEGIQTFEATVKAEHTGFTKFAMLSSDQQIAVLQAEEETPFFQTVRNLTIMGMFSHPSYGGNRDKVGWQLLQFDDRHAWQPPFGYYDEHYTEEAQDG